MATGLKSKPDSSESGANEQTHYDREFENIASNYGSTTEHPLAEREAQAGGSSPNDKKSSSSPDLKAAEYSPDSFYLRKPEKSASLYNRIKNIPARRKAFGVLGVGGIVGVVLTILTIFPTFRLPSIMGAVLSLTGHGVEEVVENRSSRYVIGYLIHKADVDAVAGNSLGGTLWRTFRAKNLEGKILRETGFEWRPVGNEVRMFYYNEHDRGLSTNERLISGEPIDLGSVRTYDDVIKLTNANPIAQKKFKKVLRIASGKRILWSSRIAQDAIKRRFPRLTYAPPEDDKSKTKAKNLADFHVREFDVVDREQRDMLNKAMGCVLADDCDFYKKQSDPVEGPSRESIPRDQEVEDFAKDVNVASDETRKEVENITEKLGEKALASELTEIAEKRLIAKLTTLTTEGPLALIGIAATIYHFAYVAQEDQLIQRIPSTAVAYTTGAQAAFFAGQADNIKAGRTPIYFINDINRQINGNKQTPPAEAAQTARLMYTGDASKGIPAAARVNNDVTKPMTSATNAVFTAQYYTIGLPFVIWYNVENLVGDIIGLFTNPLINGILSAVFGPDFQQKLYEWMVHLVLPFFAGNVDAFATGAKWMNQIFVGWSANMNWYCEAYLGCKAVSALKETYVSPDIPIKLGGVETPTVQDQQDIADLPFKDRLFSVDEPHSLLNEVARNQSISINPAKLLPNILRQISSLPTTLLATVGGRAHAAPNVTPQQIADVTGVRQYGYTASDMAHDISPEIFAADGTTDPVCPTDIDSEHQVNLCMADREVGKALMCAYTDCPEYSVGLFEQQDSIAGLWANVRQIWKDRQAMQALIW
jgi:hypothetical protein